MIYEKAHAKINLALDVVSKRDDGYHELKMIMIPLDLHDQLSFELHDDIILTSNLEIKDNAVLKTANLIKEKYNVDQGVSINLTKHIPVGAGLAGGSADIAATIRGLNKLWNLNLNKDQLESIALSLGSDTLFCLYEKPAYVYGRGEYIEFLDSPEFDDIYLFYPNISVSTAHIFKHHVVKKKSTFDQLLTYYKDKAWDLFFDHTYNDLMETTFKCHKELESIYQTLKNIDQHILMSGSGSTFFLVNSKLNMSKILQNTRKTGVKIVKTCTKT